MPKNKTKGPETPAPVTTTNPFLGMSQETRWLLSRQIDEQIAGLERTAQELLGVKHQLISAGIQAAEAQGGPGPMVALGAIHPVPARKRGRPAGSKNKPKSEGQSDGQSQASPVADTFAQAVEATKPEHDAEFAAAG